MANKYKYNLLEYLLFLPRRLNIKELKAKLGGKTILITGASYGIGEALSYKLAKANVKLILVARTKEKLLAIKQNIEKDGGEVRIFAIDLRNQRDLDELIDFVVNMDDGIDIFVSNAGISIKRSIYDSLDRYHDFSRTMALNYHAPVRLILALIPILEKKAGQIINISAINVLLPPFPHWAAYQASKVAFDQWFRSVEPELNINNIATGSIYLPLVRTRMISPTANYDKMPAMSANQAAEIISRSIIYENKNYAPWWLVFAQISSFLLNYPIKIITRWYLKRK